MPESVFLWSKTASNNGNSDSAAPWPEGMLPGVVNNSARSNNAAHAKFRDDQGGQLTTAGTQPTYTLTTNSGLTALADGVRLVFVCHSTNAGGAATLNVDALGAKTIRKGADVALSAGDLVAGGHYEVRYDASANAAAGAWLLPSVPSGEAVTGAFALTGDITPSQITANQNDYAPTGHATAAVFRLSSDASRDITGMAGGSDGLIRKLMNVGSFPIVLKDESSSSTAANRFAFSGDYTLLADETVEIIYDSTSSRWRFAVNSFSPGALPTETAPAIDDRVVLQDVSAGVPKTMRLDDALEVVNGLTEDTAPDRTADFFLSYDTSATAAKKVKPQNIPGILPGGLSVVAWVRFTVSGGTATIQSQFNVTSVSHGLTGFYTINFTNALAGTNYTYLASCQRASGSNLLAVSRISGETKTTSAFQMHFEVGTAEEDPDEAFVMILIPT